MFDRIWNILGGTAAVPQPYGYSFPINRPDDGKPLKARAWGNGGFYLFAGQKSLAEMIADITNPGVYGGGDLLALITTSTDFEVPLGDDVRWLSVMSQAQTGNSANGVWVVRVTSA